MSGGAMSKRKKKIETQKRKSKQKHKLERSFMTAELNKVRVEKLQESSCIAHTFKNVFEFLHSLHFQNHEKNINQEERINIPKTTVKESKQKKKRKNVNK